MKNMTYQLYLAKTRAHKLGLAKSNPDYFCMAHKLKWFLYFKRAFKGKEKKKKKKHTAGIICHLQNLKYLPSSTLRKFANLHTRT